MTRSTAAPDAVRAHVSRIPERRPHADDPVDDPPGSLPPGVVKFHAPELVIGPGSLAEAGYAAARLGARRPFVVTDPGLVEAGWVTELLGHLRDAGLQPVLWDGVSPNPKDHEIRAGHQAYAAGGADVVLGIGGGSAIDAAKGVALMQGNGGDILDYVGIDRATLPIPPLVMIPTTSGTGSDVSQFCIVTDTTRSVKVSIVGRALVPDISITDSRLLTTMPPDLAAATGMDALTHAVEAYVSLAHHPLADGHALSAVSLVCQYLRATMTDPSAEEPRARMAQASLEAGLAFTNAILGAAHAMSHQVGGLLDAPHGVINGVLLPHVIRFNARAAPSRFHALAAQAGLAVQGRPPEEAADELADHVRRLADDVGVPRGLRSLGLTEADLGRLSQTTLDDACLTTNPRPADADEVEALFLAAL